MHNPKLIDKYKIDALIYNASQKQGINPKVLLATLRQEQNWGLNGRELKLMGIGGTEGKPELFQVKDSINIAAAIYRKWFDVGTKSLQKKTPDVLKINQGFNYEPRTASEYSKLKYTPWTYYAPQKSRPYDQWVTYFRSFK